MRAKNATDLAAPLSFGFDFRRGDPGRGDRPDAGAIRRLTAVREYPQIDQATLGGVIAYDRTTIGGVIDRLQEKGLLRRSICKENRRIRQLTIEPEGEKLLARIKPLVAKIQDRMIAPLPANERDDFMRCMIHLADAHNERTRAPLRPVSLKNIRQRDCNIKVGDVLKPEFLATLRIELGQSYPLDTTPAGWRRIDVFKGGSLRGPRINGTIVSGTDCLLGRDESMQPDARLTIKTDDHAYIHIPYHGVRHGPADVMDKIARGEQVMPDEYYLRSAPFFETGAPRYDWLNRIVAIGVGRQEPTAAAYEIYEILQRCISNAQNSEAAMIDLYASSSPNVQKIVLMLELIGASHKLMRRRWDEHPAIARRFAAVEARPAVQRALAEIDARPSTLPTATETDLNRDFGRQEFQRSLG